MPTLTASGYPVNPRRVFIHIRRHFLQGVDFTALLRRSSEIAFPVRFVGEWYTLAGRVQQVNCFPDGRLVSLRPTPGSLLERWPRAEIWVPNIGPAGVLCY